MSSQPHRRAALCLLILLVELGLAIGAAPIAYAFDPGQIANTANDGAAFNVSIASEFRLNLQNLTPCAWKDCAVTPSQDVHITVEGPSRLSGTTPGLYHIAVEGVSSFSSNYTTIAMVLTGNASDVVIQPDASAERAGAQAYTKDLNGSRTLNVTLSPSNHTSTVTLNVIGYIGEGNRTTHGAHEVYAIVKKEIELRAMRIIPLNVTVSNDANVSVTGVNVSFYARGPNDADFVSIGNSTITAVNAKGSADTGVAWDATWADRAVYTIKAVVDPTHQHADAFEENNVLFFRVNLGDPKPDAQQAHVGQAFVIVTLAVIAVIGVGLWWYNRVYE
jgi:hypothetical protein